jgi:hypothetical protein
VALGGLLLCCRWRRAGTAEALANPSYGGMDSWGTLVDRLSRNRLKRVDASKLFPLVQRGKSTRQA